MEMTSYYPAILFRERSLDKEPSKKRRTKELEQENYLRCCACRHKITKISQKAVVQGGFEHNFLNPVGKVFRIGCFHDAGGCFNSGTPSSEWSWFQRYSWQISICRRCKIHLGWYFNGVGNPDFFYGLILDALI